MDNSVEIDKEKVTEWFKKDVLPKVSEIIKKPCDNVKIEITTPTDCFFISIVYFIHVKFYDGDSIQLVIKKPPEITSFSERMHTDAFFHNEVLFYEKIASQCKRFPRCFYTQLDAQNLQNTLIIIENIEHLGFKMCQQPYNIPMDYSIAGIREIARFHGRGYVMKTRKTEKFFKIVDNIEETRYFSGDWFQTYVNVISSRPVTYLQKQNYDPDFCSKIEKHFQNAYNMIMLDVIKPREPLAVLCHGDFTRNNIFYRKIGTDLDAMLIDFAMLRYSSPATDLSHFLYISCSMKDIRENFDVIFDAYHETLIDYLQQEGIEELSQYSRDSMLADYRRHALYGYVTSVLFVPVQRGFININPTILATAAPDELARQIREAGGDELTKEFADILIDLRHTDCLEAITSS